MRPPSAPNTVATREGAHILWLGPDEWLLLDQPGKEAETVSRLRAALTGIHSSVVDVTANRAALEVAGPDAEQVLARAAALDFHPRSFPVGSCAQTNIARTQGIVYRVGAQRFLIFVRPSFARYLALWLEDARSE
jgi:sarcosine oxidase subunit gamma